MAFTTLYGPQAASVGQAANTAGTGMQQQYLNAQQIQQNQFNADQGYRYASLAQNQNQFNADQGYRYANLNEQARQYDNSYGQNQQQFAEQVRQSERNFGEGVRQFDADQAFREQQLTQQNQQFNTQVGQNQFNNLLQAAQQQQLQANQIAASERMAMFERQSRLEAMGYGTYLETASRLYQQQGALQQQQQAQQQEMQAKQGYLQKLLSNGEISATDYAVAKAQLDQQALGIQSQDPGMLMSPMDREQYYDDLATTQARQMERQLKATTNMTVAQLQEAGYVMDMNGAFKPITTQRELDNEFKIKQLEVEQANKLEAAKQQEKADTLARQQEEQARREQAEYQKNFQSTVMDLMKMQKVVGTNELGKPVMGPVYEDINQASDAARVLLGTRGNADYRTSTGASAAATSVFSGVTGNSTQQPNNPFAAFVEQNSPIGQNTNDYRARVNAALGQSAPPTWAQANQYVNQQMQNAIPWAK